MKPHLTKHRRNKSKKLPLIFASLAAIAAVVIVIFFLFPSTPPPNPITYSSFTGNALPLVDRSFKFSVLWNSPANLSGYIFSTDLTGTWINETWIAFANFYNRTAAWSDITKTLNTTIGTNVRWKIYANNTDNKWTSTQIQTIKVTSNKVLLTTTMGTITIQLYDTMPITTQNFRNLVERKIYDGTIFHRVIDGFMIQGGDPTGTGSGDPSIPAIPDEFTNYNRNDRGTIAMANAGPNTGSSQFFINLVNNNYLDAKHPVFGRVIAGMDVVDAIGKVATGENDRPLEEVRITKAELIR